MRRMLAFTAAALTVALLIVAAAATGPGLAQAPGKPGRTAQWKFTIDWVF